MDFRISELIKEINELNILGKLKYYTVGNNHFVSIASNFREPAISVFGSSRECYLYLCRLKNSVIGDSNIKKSDKKITCGDKPSYLYMVWYGGEYMGTFEGISHSDVCKKALAGKDLLGTEVVLKRLSGKGFGWDR